MELYEKYKSLFDTYHVNTDLRKAHLMAQLEHESDLKPISENLNYSPKRLSEVFPKYFPNAEIANVYSKNGDAAIASRVYADRMGNGNEKSMDGYKYRGRGFIQLTGKDNYLLLSKDTRIDFITNPDLLLTEANALISALWFWNKRKLNDLADQDDCKGITKLINGGYNGLESRLKLVEKWKSKMKI